MNQSLRQALFRSRLSEQDVAARLHVDPKTVRRWLEGRLPYARHRWDLAQLLEVDESHIWPELRSTGSRPPEITAVYARRSSIDLDGWLALFDAAERNIDILVYSGLFLAESAELLQLLANKAKHGVRLRIALGDPFSQNVKRRGDEESIGDAMAAKIRNALVLYRPLLSLQGVELRFHRSSLYNSLYRADDQMLVNQHIYGMPASRAPVLNLRRIAGGEMFMMHAEAFERVWLVSTPSDTDGCE